MKKPLLYSSAAIVLLLLSACGGGSTFSAGSNAPVVDNSFSIDLSKVSGYSSTDPIEDQYLAVVNYLRSQHLQCNDHLGISGPSNALTVECRSRCSSTGAQHGYEYKRTVRASRIWNSLRYHWDSCRASEYLF